MPYFIPLSINYHDNPNSTFVFVARIKFYEEIRQNLELYGSQPMTDYAATNSILIRIPVASAIFSKVLSVKPSYSPLSIQPRTFQTKISLQDKS
jgi:hypothetical protein